MNEQTARIISKLAREVSVINSLVDPKQSITQEDFDNVPKPEDYSVSLNYGG